MSVRKREWTTSKGTVHTAWVVAYRDRNGKQRQKTFPRERQARAWEAQTTVDLKKGVHRPDSTSITVGEAAALWLERARGDDLEAETLRTYETLYRAHIRSATVPDDTASGWHGKLGDLKLSQLTTPMCVAFQRQLTKTLSRHRDSDGVYRLKKFISRVTARKILAAFKAILREAETRGMIDHSPARPLRMSLKGRDRLPVRVGDQIPRKEDVRAILVASVPADGEKMFGRGTRESEFARYRWHVLFSTAAFTGMRASELRGLVWSNVDLDRGIISVLQRANRFGDIGKCKSSSAYRDVLMGTELVALLRRWREICPPTPLSLVFPSSEGAVETHSRLLNSGWWAVQYRMGLLRRNGLPKYTFHSLRHFYASIMIEAGTPPKRLQEALGHKTLAMTMDTYGHLFPAGDDESVRINKAVGAVLAAQW